MIAAQFAPVLAGPDLEPGLSPAVRIVLGAARAHAHLRGGLDRPFPFALRYAAARGGVSRSTARRAIRRLVAAGKIRAESAPAPRTPTRYLLLDGSLRFDPAPEQSSRFQIEHQQEPDLDTIPPLPPNTLRTLGYTVTEHETRIFETSPPHTKPNSPHEHSLAGAWAGVPQDGKLPTPSIGYPCPPTRAHARVRETKIYGNDIDRSSHNQELSGYAKDALSRAPGWALAAANAIFARRAAQAEQTHATPTPTPIAPHSQTSTPSDTIPDETKPYRPWQGHLEANSNGGAPAPDAPIFEPPGGGGNDSFEARVPGNLSSIRGTGPPPIALPRK